MDKDECYIHMKGLPWSAGDEEILKFFEDCKISGSNKGIEILKRIDGRSIGEAIVEFEDQESLEKALSKNKQHIGTRYVEIFKIKKSQIDNVRSKVSPHSVANDKAMPIVRLRGVPYDCTKEEVANFFTSLEIAPNGINFLTDQMGRCNGTAFVQFLSEKSLAPALAKHKNMIGHRYIEVYESNIDDLSSAFERQLQVRRPFFNNLGFPAVHGNPFISNYNKYRFHFYEQPFYQNHFKENRSYYGAYYDNQYSTRFNNYRGQMGDRGGFYLPNTLGPRFFNNQSRPRSEFKRPFIGGYINKPNFYRSSTGHTVQLRGLPFSVSDEDIIEFFSGIPCSSIYIQKTSSQKPTGLAYVDFKTNEEVIEALKKNKSNIGARYVEVYHYQDNRNYQKTSAVPS